MGTGLTLLVELPWLSGVMNELGNQVLKGVSRSFYLSLRLLPGQMRAAASLGYLLARTSDTLADCHELALEVRQESLEYFRACVADELDFSKWETSILNAIPDAREKHLLASSVPILNQLRKLPAGESYLVREVLRIIISGQRLDLQRFAAATKSQPVALVDDAALEDYAWRVAGSVGAFWTKLGFLTMGENFSKSSEEKMLAWGISYGVSLQLVNILRDLAEDLHSGRCYLPVANPLDLHEVLNCHAQWLDRAEIGLSNGVRYAGCLESRRLRAATLLPALLARKTLTALHGVSWENLQTRIKIPRRAVYGSLIAAMLKNASGTHV